MTTRGMKEAEMLHIVDLIDSVLMNHDNETFIASVKSDVNKWVQNFPLYM
jgi:glycine hydroxymethyltransferase